jgi:hypothetical protein
VYRFVDLTEAYWTCGGDPLCAILDTVTDTFLEVDGGHVLCDLDDVQSAGGDRAVGLVPDGFFGRCPVPGGLRRWIEMEES